MRIKLCRHQVVSHHAFVQRSWGRATALDCTVDSLSREIFGICRRDFRARWTALGHISNRHASCGDQFCAGFAHLKRALCLYSVFLTELICIFMMSLRQVCIQTSLALQICSTLWTVTYCNTTECPIKLFPFTYFLLSYIKQVNTTC